MTLAVTVITASLPHRAHLLVEAHASVLLQTVPAAHSILVDASIPVAEARNRLLAQVSTNWVAFLDDDDLLDPHHIEVLTRRAAAGDVDVVIPYCRFDGPALPAVNHPFDLDALRDHGIFPITVLARTEAIRAAGCFHLDDTWEDWSLWNRMADAGARFAVVPEVTWTYRTAHAEDRRTTAIAEGRAQLSQVDRRAARRAARRARLEGRDTP